MQTEDVNARDVAQACDTLMDRLEEFLDPRHVGRRDPWDAFPYPALDRGAHAIIPLLITSSPDDGDLAACATELERRWGFRYGGHDFRVGRFSDTDEWGKRELSLSLDAMGARRTMWWPTHGHAVIYAKIVGADRERTSVALHVVPEDWVRAGNLTPPRTNRDLSRARRVTRDAAAADLRWDASAFADSDAGLWVTRPRTG